MAYNIIWMIGMDIIKIGLYRLLDGWAKFKQRFVKTLNQPLHSHSAE